MAQITGIGGIFFKAQDPQALAAWYRDMLGLAVEDWGGIVMKPRADGPPFTLWSPFAADTTYMAPSTREHMINFAVDDLDDFVAQLAAKGVDVLGRDDSDPNGRFAWILDPEGTKVELWQPTAPA